MTVSSVPSTRKPFVYSGVDIGVKQFSFAKPFAAPEAPATAPSEPAVNFDRRRFTSVENTPNGECTSETRFEYRQRGSRVWATYSGGQVRFGSLVAVGDERGHLDMRYQHVGADNALRTGTCLATAETLADGRLRLVEDWQWTNGDLSKGRSVVEEIATAE